MQDASGRKLMLLPLEGDLAAYVQKAVFRTAQALQQTEPAAGDALQVTLGAYEKSIEWGNYCGEKPSVQEKKHFAFEIDIFVAVNSAIGLKMQYGKQKSVN